MRFCYGYPDFPCADTPIDDFDIPDECRRKLIRTGIEYIGDVLDVYARIHEGPPMDGFPLMGDECYTVIVQKLIAIDCWPWPEETARWLETED